MTMPGHPNNLLKTHMLPSISVNAYETKEVSFKGDKFLGHPGISAASRVQVEQAGQLGYSHTICCPLPGAALQNKAVNWLKTNHLTA